MMFLNVVRSTVLFFYLQIWENALFVRVDLQEVTFFSEWQKGCKKQQGKKLNQPTLKTIFFLLHQTWTWVEKTKLSVFHGLEAC